MLDGALNGERHQRGEVEGHLGCGPRKIQVGPVEQPELDQGVRWRLRLHRGHQAPVECSPPSTWIISPVVLGKKSLSNATTALAAGVMSFGSQPIGAREPHT